MSKSLILEQENVTANLKVQVRKFINASRQKVFDAWTKPELIQQWFAPGNMSVPSATSDLRVGGVYRIEMMSPTAECFSASGIYKSIIPNEELSFTWRGNCDLTEETLVTVEFKDMDKGTEVILTHERFATESSMGRHEQGWKGSLEKLAKFFQK